MITGMPRIAIAVHDFAEVVSLFSITLGMPVIDISDSSVDSLGASLAMCVPAGGSNIELMCPARPEAPLAQSLSRFLDRRGQGLFALMLEANVPDEAAELLSQRGLAVLPLMPGAGGRDVHPKSTHGVLIRVYPTHSFQGTLEQGDNGVGLSGIMRVVIAVSDIEAARKTYGEKLGLETGPVRSDEHRGLLSVKVQPPTGGEIELAQAVDVEKDFGARLAAQVTHKGEGLHALVLGSDDLGRTRQMLIARDLEVIGDRWLELPEERSFGARILIEQS